MYTGVTTLELTNAEREELYTKERLSKYVWNENEYLYVPPAVPEAKGDYFQYRGGRFQRIKFPSINNEWTGSIKPRNPEQYCALDLLQNTSIKLKVLKGVYGSGKDYLMLGAALSLIEKGLYSKLIYIRPNIIVRDLPDIGALPGTADEKLAWTLGPFMDKLGGNEGVELLIHQGILETIPLIYIRGRSFNNTIIYVSEGQNMTSEIIKLLIGRVGTNSQLWINGDTHQTDKATFDRDNGLNILIDSLKNHPLFGYVYLPKTERSEVANLANIIDEYERHLQNH